MRHFLLTFRIFFFFKCEGIVLKVRQHLRVVDISRLFHSITNSNAALNEFSYFKMCVRLIRRAMTRTYVLLFAFRHVWTLKWKCHRISLHPKNYAFNSINPSQIQRCKTFQGHDHRGCFILFGFQQKHTYCYIYSWHLGWKPSILDKGTCVF